MPELPEVQTIITDLKKVLLKLVILDVWTDWAKMIKYPKKFIEFQKELVGKKILDLKRLGKNILINLSGDKTLLIHQKLTGHLLYGKWKLEGKEWKSIISGPLSEDPQNRFIHLIISLSNGKQLALSDLRKFAKVLIAPTEKLEQLPEIKKLGAEPLEQAFDFRKFYETLKNKRGKIKTILMNQGIIAGIGNIYSDEILWVAGIHPLKPVEKLKENELKKIFSAIKKVLQRAIKARGDSMSNYRHPSGGKGQYQKFHNAYQMDGKKCSRGDGGTIERIKLANRSAHFCPVHQKL